MQKSVRSPRMTSPRASFAEEVAVVLVASVVNVSCAVAAEEADEEGGDSVALKCVDRMCSANSPMFTFHVAATCFRCNNAVGDMEEEDALVGDEGVTVIRSVAVLSRRPSVVPAAVVAARI